MLSNISADRLPITVGDVVAARAESLRPLVSVDAHMSVSEAIEVLGEHGLISAPVKDNQNDTYLGIVNMLELFVYAGLLNADKDNKAVSERLAEPVLRVLENFPDNLSLWRCDASDSLDKVLVAFRKGVHRVLVFDETHPEASGSKAPVLVSQSDVVKYLNSTPELVPADKVVGSGLGFVANEKTDPVVTVSMATSAAEAFKLLAENDMTAVPIVDAEGRIVGTVSASDLRGANPEIELSKNVLDFLQTKHARGSAAPVSVGLDAHIGEILIPLSYAGVHRVWVVDAEKRPVGVVSMSDVIGCVCAAIRA